MTAARSCAYCGVPTEARRGDRAVCRRRRCLVKWVVSVRAVRVGRGAWICLQARAEAADR